MPTLMPEEPTGAEMPTNTSRTINLSEDQRKTLFGEAPLEPGVPTTVTLVPGDMGEGGMQSFTVEEAPEAAPEPPSTLPPLGDDDDESAEDVEDPAEAEAPIPGLGYDRAKLTSQRKKNAAPINPKDLEFD